MHTNLCSPLTAVPTRHCACVRSDGICNSLKNIKKDTCLFFDQVNNYAKFSGAREWRSDCSTDLSTDFVDNGACSAAPGAPAKRACCMSCFEIRYATLCSG